MGKKSCSVLMLTLIQQKIVTSNYKRKASEGGNWHGWGLFFKTAVDVNTMTTCKARFQLTRGKSKKKGENK